MYCAFIDFKKAFHNVDHKLLYNKLYHLGLSSKIINIIRQIYDKAYLTLEMNGNKSSSIKINRGVLQGDSLSPQLLSLFVSDFDRFLSEAGLEGVSIDAENSISYIQKWMTIC